jgi:alpha-tubulin suppressor-like RCC1 family protein
VIEQNRKPSFLRACRRFPGRAQLVALVVTTAAVPACDGDDPVLLQLPPMSAVAVGDAHSCALSETGAVYCWGDNDAGQLGTGSTASARYAVPVESGEAFISIVAGGRHTCALTALGQAWCWGANDWGQAGATPGLMIAEPRPVDTPLRFSALSAGWEHTCGIALDGRAHCWGRGDSGELGGGAVAGAVSTPITVATALTFSDISAGGRHTCAVAVDGGAYCWGANDLGQLGMGADGSPQYSPVAVQSGADFVDISAGYSHSCAVTDDGRAFCWGESRYGELGNNWKYEGGRPAENRPAGVTAFGTFYIAISAGRHYTCGLRDNHELMCWGRGAHGQLGITDMTDRIIPQLVRLDPGREFVPGNGIFTSVDAGGSTHTCATTEDARILCWGQGEAGQLGSGEWLTLIPYPVKLGGS